MIMVVTFEIARNVQPATHLFEVGLEILVKLYAETVHAE